jgi:hypothetical protein
MFFSIFFHKNVEKNSPGPHPKKLFKNYFFKKILKKNRTVHSSVLHNEKDISIIHIILQMILNLTSCQVVVGSIYPKPLRGLEVSIMKQVG